MCLDSSVVLLISLKQKKIQKISMTSDIIIRSTEYQVQQNISLSWFSFEQNCNLVGKKLRYPLPRHSFSTKFSPVTSMITCKDSSVAHLYYVHMNSIVIPKFSLQDSWATPVSVSGLQKLPHSAVYDPASVYQLSTAAPSARACACTCACAGSSLYRRSARTHAHARAHAHTSQKSR